MKSLQFASSVKDRTLLELIKSLAPDQESNLWHPIAAHGYCRENAVWEFKKYHRRFISCWKALNDSKILRYA